MSYKFADLFCGCGGMSLGLIDAGFVDTIAADFWDVAMKNYLSYHKLSKTNFHQTNMFNEDERLDLIEAIKAAGLEIITPVLVCNSGDYPTFDTFTGKAVSNDDIVIELAK